MMGANVIPAGSQWELHTADLSENYKKSRVFDIEVMNHECARTCVFIKTSFLGRRLRVRFPSRE